MYELHNAHASIGVPVPILSCPHEKGPVQLLAVAASSVFWSAIESPCAVRAQPEGSLASPAITAL